MDHRRLPLFWLIAVIALALPRAWSLLPEDWGREARDLLRVITPSTVRLVRHDIDRYARVIGEVFSDNPTDPEDFENINLALIYSGMAAVYPQYCGDQRYYDVERAARENRAGIWAVPGLQQTPWAFRER